MHQYSVRLGHHQHFGTAGFGIEAQQVGGQTRSFDRYIRSPITAASRNHRIVYSREAIEIEGDIRQITACHPQIDRVLAQIDTLDQRRARNSGFVHYPVLELGVVHRADARVSLTHGRNRRYQVRVVALTAIFLLSESRPDLLRPAGDSVLVSSGKRLIVNDCGLSSGDVV